jgi:hypothetical protein
MTLKSRWVGLVTILALFAMAPSLFAQVTITIIPDNNPGDIQTNHNVQASIPNTKNAGVLVVGQLLATSLLSTTTLYLTYPGPITSTPSAVPGAFSAGSGLGTNSAGVPTSITGAGNPATVNCTTGGIKPSGSTGINPMFVCGGNATGIPSADPIRVVGGAGVFAGVSAALLNTSANRLEIPIPSSGGSSNSSSGSFRVVGVRLDGAVLTGAQTVTATLNTSDNGYILGSPNSGTVVASLNAGISGIAIGLAPGNSTIAGNINNPASGTATIFTNGTVARAQGAFILTEGCAACWRTATQESNSGAPVDNSSQIRLTFNNIPAGVTLSLALSTGTSSNNASLYAVVSPSTVTSASNTAIIDFVTSPDTIAGGTSTSKIETLEVDYTVVTPLSTSAAISTAATVSVTGTMFPIGTGFDTTTSNAGTALPTESGGYPQFNEADVGPVTIVNIVPANTTLLIPFAFVGGAFDTGIAIANTTADPFTLGGGGAIPKGGTIIFSFFPNNATGNGAGAPFSLTTSSTATFTGMSSDGTLAPGATMSTLLSQILAAAGHPGGYLGYIFVQTNFVDAHGAVTISDFKTYSLTSNVLVMPSPATVPRTSHATESLDF